MLCFFTVHNNEHYFSIAFLVLTILHVFVPLLFLYCALCLTVWPLPDHNLFWWFGMQLRLSSHLHPTASVLWHIMALNLTFGSNSEPTEHTVLTHISLIVWTNSQRTERSQKVRDFHGLNQMFLWLPFCTQQKIVLLCCFSCFFPASTFKGNISSAFSCIISHCSKSTKKRPDHHTWYPVDVRASF